MTSRNITPAPPEPGGRRRSFGTKLSEAWHARAARAALECGMTTAQWLREVVEGAVELHEDPDQTMLDMVDPPVDAVWDAVDPPVDVSPEGYEVAVREAARVARRQNSALQRGQVKKKRKYERTADCPHMPRRRSGGTCTDCGLNVGARLEFGRR